MTARFASRTGDAAQPRRAREVPAVGAAQTIGLVVRLICRDEALQAIGRGIVDHAETCLEAIPRVAAEEGVEEAAFLREEEITAERVTRVVVGKIDVVEMHPDTWAQPGQHFMDQIVHLAAGFDGMGRIDEQEIVLAEVGNDVEVDDLRRLDHQPDLPLALGLAR